MLVGSILFYRSYALYKEEKEFNVIQGRIPDFNYDVKLAIVVDGEKQERIPEKPETGFYKVEVVCDKGTGSWDYKNWRVQVSDFSNNTKCNVSFTTSEEEIVVPEMEAVSLKLQQATAKNKTATSITFSPSTDMESVIIGGRRWGGVYYATLKDSSGNTLSTVLISASANDSGLAAVNEVTIHNVNCSLKKGETYTLFIPAPVGSSDANYAFVIYS